MHLQHWNKAIFHPCEDGDSISVKAVQYSTGFVNIDPAVDFLLSEQSQQ